jgi:pimeloyl-ACP methyl ester carboxylesterase
LCLEWPADPSAAPPIPDGSRLPDVPALVLNGGLDANTCSVSGRETAAQFPRGEFEEVKDAGHTVMVTPQGAKRAMDFSTQHNL